MRQREFSLPKPIRLNAVKAFDLKWDLLTTSLHAARLLVHLFFHCSAGLANPRGAEVGRQVPDNEDQHVLCRRALEVCDIEDGKPCASSDQDTPPPGQQPARTIWVGRAEAAFTCLEKGRAESLRAGMLCMLASKDAARNTCLIASPRLRSLEQHSWLQPLTLPSEGDLRPGDL